MTQNKTTPNSQQKPGRSVDDKTQHFSEDYHSADNINDEIKDYLLRRDDIIKMDGEQLYQFKIMNIEYGKREAQKMFSFEIKRLIIDIEKHWDKVVNPKENFLKALKELKSKIGGKDEKN